MPPGTKELKELSLAINTSEGMVLVVGCSHPGIEKIVEAATAINPKIHLIAGGFHLVGCRKGGGGSERYIQGRKYCAGPLHGRANVRGVEESFR